MDVGNLKKCERKGFSVKYICSQIPKIAGGIMPVIIFVWLFALDIDMYSASSTNKLLFIAIILILLSWIAICITVTACFNLVYFAIDENLSPMPKRIDCDGKQNGEHRA